MTEEEFQQRASRLAAVNKVVASLDPAIRHDAFQLLRAFVVGKHESGAADSASDAASPGVRDAPQDGDLSEEEFFTRFSTGQPAAQAMAVAAFHYGKYGSEPFSLDDVRETADRVGLTVPTRLDMTFKGSRRDGKPLFQKAGRGMLRPTVIGEAFLKSEYGVSKGRSKRKTDAPS